jgi:hypothetical protein
MAISVALLFGFFKQIMHIKGYASARPFCESVLAAMDEDEPLYFYDSYRPNIHYYMHRRMPEFRRSNEKVVEALGRSRRVFLVLRARHMKYLEAGDALDDYLIEEITGARVGSRDMICVLVHRSEAVD